MDQNPSGESEHGLRADSALYLHLLLQCNVLKALFTAEALLHTSYSFFGSCGGCRNNEIIIPIIHSDGGNESTFVRCSRLHQLRWLCSTSRPIFVEASGTFWPGQRLVTYVGAGRPQQTLDASTRQKSSPWGIPTDQVHPHSPQNTCHALLGRGSSEMQTADGRELNSD